MTWSDAIHEFFTRPRRARWSGDHNMRSPPDRLVYLLDHEYTQRGFSGTGSRMRTLGVRPRCGQSATELDCEIFLALADVHETWSCEEEYSGYSDYGERFYGDDDDDADERDEEENTG